MRRLVAAGGADGFLQQNLSTFGYLCVCLNVFFFGYIFVTDPFIPPYKYNALTREDSYVENATAILLFLTGILFVIVATTERHIFQRCVYILGCVAFMLASGEEISWGQRIFDFETPEKLMNLNEIDEFTIHNLRIGEISLFTMLTAILIYGTFMFCVIICAAFFCNKNTFLGIPLPSIPLMLSFLIVVSHEPIIIDSNRYIFTMDKELLLIFIIYILFSNKISLIIYTIATMILILVIPHMYYYNGRITNHYEMQEFLLSLCFLFYSLELLQAQKYASAAQNSPNNILTYMIGICVISAGIYLAFLTYNRPEMILRHQQELSNFLNDTNPIIRAKFDVYLKEKLLIYARDDCNSEDINMRFFLHIDPIRQSDLPDRRKQYGFGKRNFRFMKRGDFFDGQRCIMVRHLPGYDIAKITTGQFVEDRQIWIGTFTFM